MLNARIVAVRMEKEIAVEIAKRKVLPIKLCIQCNKN